MNAMVSVCDGDIGECGMVSGAVVNVCRSVSDAVTVVNVCASGECMCARM